MRSGHPSPIRLWRPPGISCGLGIYSVGGSRKQQLPVSFERVPAYTSNSRYAHMSKRSLASALVPDTGLGRLPGQTGRWALDDGLRDRNHVGVDLAFRLCAETRLGGEHLQRIEVRQRSSARAQRLNADMARPGVEMGLDALSDHRFVAPGDPVGWVPPLPRCRRGALSLCIRSPSPATRERVPTPGF
jgi:hypothetical protein